MVLLLDSGAAFCMLTCKKVLEPDDFTTLCMPRKAILAVHSCFKWQLEPTTFYAVNMGLYFAYLDGTRYHPSSKEVNLATLTINKTFNESIREVYIIPRPGRHFGVISCYIRRSAENCSSGVTHRWGTHACDPPKTGKPRLPHHQLETSPDRK